MNSITVDPALLRDLGRLDCAAELRDPTGKVLGYFTPVTDPSLYVGVESPTSEEELDRRSREGGGRQLGEILRDLERRG